MKIKNCIVFLVFSVLMPSLVLAQGDQDDIAKKCLGLQHWSMVKCAELERSKAMQQPSQTNFAGDTKASIERGKTVFSQNCYVCHGSEGKGNGPSSEYLRGPVFDLTQAKVQQQTDAELMQKIIKGNSPMPSFADKFIHKDDLVDVINYIRTLSKEKDVVHEGK